MFECLKRLFKEEKIEKIEKDEEDEKEEIDYEKYFNQKVPENLTLVFSNGNYFYEIELHVYFKCDYIGHIIVNRAKVEALDSDEEKRILAMISKMVKDYEEELEQLRLRKELVKEKLEFMRLRNEMLKAKLMKDKAGLTQICYNLNNQQ